MAEGNPNHPMTKAMNDQWHKLMAVSLHKLGMKEIVLMPDDIITALEMPGGINIGIEDKGDQGVRIFLLDDTSANEAVQRESNRMN